MRDDELPAGHELDALVAEKVMGWEWRDWKPYCAPSGWYSKGAADCDPDACHSADLPLFSFDLAAAWSVVEKLTSAIGWRIYVLPGRVEVNWVRAATTDGQPFINITTQADTAPLAICRAALKSVGV